MYEFTESMPLERGFNVGTAKHTCSSSTYEKSKISNRRVSELYKLWSKTKSQTNSLWKNLFSKELSFMRGFSKRSEFSTREPKTQIRQVSETISRPKNESMYRLWIYAKTCLSDGLGSYKRKTFRRQTRKQAINVCELSQIKEFGKRGFFNTSNLNRKVNKEVLCFL